MIQHHRVIRNRSRAALAGNISRIATLVLAITLTAGCATTGGGGSSSVVKRAEARWEALLAGEFENAYQYYSPGYRSSHSLGDFELEMRLRKVHFSGADFVEEQCEAERCNLKFNVKYRVASPVPGIDTWESKSVLDETWVRTRNEWWYLPDD